MSNDIKDFRCLSLIDWNHEIASDLKLSVDFHYGTVWRMFVGLVTFSVNSLLYVDASIS